MLEAGIGAIVKVQKVAAETAAVLAAMARRHVTGIVTLTSAWPERSRPARLLG
jgi:hypothetical protein